MGGYPDHALLALLLGPDLRVDWLRDFVGGLSAACLRYSLQLVGGDISALPPGQFSAVLSVTGHLEHAPLLRRGAQVGDAIFVTGQLGGSIEGHHYQFVPRLAEGQWLARSGLVSSCMDLTDGLAKDLPALLPRGSAAKLDLDRIPLSPSAQAAAGRTGQSALDHAFGDGEDYELLFTLKASADARAFAASWEAAFPQTPLSQIATITQGREGHSFIDAATGEAMFFHGGFKQWKTDA
jgi:thiamine-monophosphate kinase